MDWIFGAVTVLGLVLFMFANGPAWVLGVVLVLAGIGYFLLEKFMGVPIDAWIRRNLWLP